MTTRNLTTPVLLAIALAAPQLVCAGARTQRAGSPTAAAAMPSESSAKGVRVMRVVERDDAKREIRITLISDQPRAGQTISAPLQLRPRYGRLVIRNRSIDFIDTYISLDDDVTPWEFLDTLPPNYRLRVRLLRGLSYLVAGDTAGEDDAHFDWRRAVSSWASASCTRFSLEPH